MRLNAYVSGACIAWIAVVTGCDRGSDVSVPLPTLETPAAKASVALEAKYLSNIRCQQEVDSILDGATGFGGQRFAARREWSMVPSRGRDGSVTLMSPTTLPGMWVVVRRFLSREVQVERVTARFTSVFNFAVDPKNPDLDTCEIRKKSRSAERRFDEESMARALDDRDVLDLVKTNRLGVIYVWSPNMPYSYSSQQNGMNANGLINIRRAIARASRELGEPIALTVAVDPAAALPLIDEIVANEPELDPSMARPAQSIELLFRNVNHHYPAVLVYADTIISRHVYPGVETVEKYEEVILSAIEAITGTGTGGNDDDDDDDDDDDGAEEDGAEEDDADDDDDGENGRDEEARE